eukprot:14330705-Alexandrium_andersonii.AAC.1
MVPRPIGERRHPTCKASPSRAALTLPGPLMLLSFSRGFKAPMPLSTLVRPRNATSRLQVRSISSRMAQCFRRASPCT